MAVVPVVIVVASAVKSFARCQAGRDRRDDQARYGGQEPVAQSSPSTSVVVHDLPPPRHVGPDAMIPATGHDSRRGATQSRQDHRGAALRFDERISTIW